MATAYRALAEMLNLQHDCELPEGCAQDYFFIIHANGCADLGFW